MPDYENKWDDPEDLSSNLAVAVGGGAVLGVLTWAITGWWLPGSGLFATIVGFSTIAGLAASAFVGAGTEPNSNKRSMLNRVVAVATVASVVAGLVVSVITAPGTEDNSPQIEDPGLVYSDVECNALLGFARRDSITSSEKADALDEYEANC